jgi:hypothetical protein
VQARRGGEVGRSMVGIQFCKYLLYSGDVPQPLECESVLLYDKKMTVAISFLFIYPSQGRLKETALPILVTKESVRWEKSGK